MKFGALRKGMNMSKTRNPDRSSAVRWSEELMPDMVRTEAFVAWLDEMLKKKPQPQDFLIVGTETVCAWSPSLGASLPRPLARSLLSAMDGDAEEFHANETRPVYYAKAYDLPRGNLISEHRIERESKD